MATKKRTVDLPLVQAKVTNLNFKPEKHGAEFQPRADMSIEFLVQDEHVDEFVNTKSNPLKVLWHGDGAPMFRELGDTGIPIALKAQGTAKIGASEEALLTFDTATLKSIRVKPLINRQLQVSCQIRVDPTDHLDELGDLAVHQSAVVSFDGSQVANGNKNEDQGKLEV